MLTYPSDSLPQIVCPMDDDVLPSNPFRSAPPHSEPPPPLLPFSSITPSCENDGIPRHRRSGGIEGIVAEAPRKQSHAVGKETPKPSPAKSQTERGNMVSESELQELQELESSEKVFEEQNKEGLAFPFPAEHLQTWDVPVGSAAGGDVKQGAENAVQSEMDTCPGLAFEDASGPKGWVIGPLFQSFKSKMASFTEIVLSPAKLFRAHSPLSMDREDGPAECNPQDAGASDADPRDAPRPSGRPETENQGAVADRPGLNDAECVHNGKTAVVKYLKRLVFDDGLSEHRSELADACATSPTEEDPGNSVPPPGSPGTVSKQVSECIESVIQASLLWEPSVALSASPQYLSTKSHPGVERGAQAVRPKPPQRKRTAQRAGSKRVPAPAPLISEVTEKKSNPEAGERLSRPNPVQTSEADPGPAEKNSSPVVGCTRLHPDHHDDADDDDDKVKNADACGLVPQSTWDISNDAATAGLSRSKRGLGESCQSRELASRKKARGVIGAEDSQVAAVADCGTARRPRPLIKEVLSTILAAHAKETSKAAGSTQTASTRAKRKGKEGICEQVFSSKTESPIGRMVCSLDASGVPTRKKLNGDHTTPNGSGKRLKTNKADVNVDSVDLQTTVAISCAGPSRQEPAPGIPRKPEAVLLQSASKRRTSNKKPLKRKTPIQGALALEGDGTSASESPALLPGLASVCLGAPRVPRREEDLKAAQAQPSKKPRKGLRGDAGSSGPSGTPEARRRRPSMTKESSSRAGTSKGATHRGRLERNPRTDEQGCVLVQNEVQQFPGDDSTSLGLVSDEVFPMDAEASRHSINGTLRLADNKRRRGRNIHSRTPEGEEVPNTVTTEDADLAAAAPSRLSGTAPSKRLLRSYSCPELPSLLAPRTPTRPRRPSLRAPLVPQVHKFVRRARRHTVCSVEVEREIVPLCLRKEVYPTRRSAPCDGFAGRLSPGLAHSPGTYLSALASCFLSSPLAFLSKKIVGRGAAAGLSSPGSSCHATSDSSSSGHLLERETERRQDCKEQEDEEGEDTSSSSHEYEELVMREEKALSDSEIKVDHKLEERPKVSSIRIRKTLPKPQNNLTPMGLPKLVRLKKKMFSLEEIYTNKNFSKPPESRLETVFEVPLSRRNGSEAWFGQRRVKRFLEFLEVGEARKAKKPLVGAAKAGAFSPRTRRGSFAKEEPALGARDADSLLCAKLDQLSLWLMHDEGDG